MTTPNHFAQVIGVIKSSTDASDVTKRICLFLLEKTQMLKIPIIIEINETDFSIDVLNDIGTDVDDMVSDACNTHLNRQLRKAHSPFRFGSSYGTDSTKIFIKKYGRLREPDTSYLYRDVAESILAIEL